MSNKSREKGAGRVRLVRTDEMTPDPFSCLGETTCAGIGGDPVNSTGFVDVLPLFAKDPETQAIVMIDEIGGNAAEKSAESMKENVRKPTVRCIAGFTDPPDAVWVMRARLSR